MKKVLRNKKALALFIIPGFLLYTGLVIIPILYTCVYSLYTGTPGLNWEFVGLGNCRKLFLDPKVKNAFFFTMKFVVFSLFGQVGIGLLLALMFRFWLRKFKNFVRTITFFPIVLPIIAVGQLFRKIYEIQPNYGLVNSLLSNIGLEQHVTAWLGEPETAFICLLVMTLWNSVGFYAVILYGGLLDIPNDIIESARMDGANSFRLFKDILSPLLRPIIITCVVFSFTGSIKVFESIVALTKGGPGEATVSLAKQMYDTAFEAGNYGYGSAIAMVIFIVCIIGTYIIKKFDVKERE